MSFCCTLLRCLIDVHRSEKPDVSKQSTRQDQKGKKRHRGDDDAQNNDEHMDDGDEEVVVIQPFKKFRLGAHDQPSGSDEGNLLTPSIRGEWSPLKLVDLGTLKASGSGEESSLSLIARSDTDNAAEDETEVQAQLRLDNEDDDADSHGEDGDEGTFEVKSRGDGYNSQKDDEDEGKYDDALAEKHEDDEDQGKGTVNLRHGPDPENSQIDDEDQDQNHHAGSVEPSSRKSSGSGLALVIDEKGLPALVVDSEPSSPLPASKRYYDSSMKGFNEGYAQIGGLSGKLPPPPAGLDEAVPPPPASLIKTARRLSAEYDRAQAEKSGTDGDVSK